MSRPRIPSLSVKLKGEIYLSLKPILKNIQPDDKSAELSVKIADEGFMKHYQILISGMNDSKFTGHTTTISRKKFAGKLAESFNEVFGTHCTTRKIQEDVPDFGKVKHNIPIYIEYDPCNFKNKQSIKIVIDRGFFDKDTETLLKIVKAFSIAAKPKTKAKSANAENLYAIEEERSI
jgi:hypothetical protein